MSKNGQPQIKNTVGQFILDFIAFILYKLICHEYVKFIKFYPFYFKNYNTILNKLHKKYNHNRKINNAFVLNIPIIK